MPGLRPWFLFVLLMVAGWARTSWAAPEPLDIKEVCTAAILRAEKLEGIPDRLLLAVAMAESGRWDKATRSSYAWPWTVTNGGAGSFFDDQAAAMQHVMALKGAGQTNIDVGCMQVNLRAHPKAFSDLESAFDPLTNARYAARFLKQLFQETGDWSKAVAYYHSRTPEKGNAYRERVYARLDKLAPSERALAAATEAATAVGRAPALSADDKAAAQKVMTIWRWLREGQRSSIFAQASAAESDAAQKQGQQVQPAVRPQHGGAGGIAIGGLVGAPQRTVANR